MAISQSIPPYGAMVERDSLAPTPVWYSFFLSQFQQTGGGSGIIVSGQNFAAQAPGTIFAGPASGGSTKPSFRTLVSSDMAGIAGSFPGVANATSAPVGDVGEYIFQTNGGALTSATPTDIATLALTAGDWDVWANFYTTPAGGASQTLLKAWISTTSATDPGPANNGAYVQHPTTAGEVGAQALPVGMMRLSLGAGSAAFLSAAVTFTGGTMSGNGFIGARRRR